MRPDRGPSSPPDGAGDLRATGNVLVLVILCAASTVQLLLRKPGTVGPRYFGAKPLGGVALLLAFAAVRNVGDYDPRVLPGYIAALLVLCVIHRATSYRRMKQGVPLHRYYVGDSLFYNDRQPRFSGRTTRAFDAIFGPALAAWAQMFGATTLAYWLLIASGASVLSTLMLELRERERDHAMRDAMIEQATWADRARRTAVSADASHQGPVYRPSKYVKSRVTDFKEIQP